MARKSTETRSIISTDGGAAAAPASRRTARVTPTQRTSAATPTETPKKQATAASTAASAGETAVLQPEEIAKLAYSYWQERGGHHGSPEQDWVRAEQELLRRHRASTR
jgi:hypothetical protein